MTETAEVEVKTAEDGGSSRPGGTEGLDAPAAPPPPQPDGDPSPEESPAPEGGDAASSIARSIKEVSHYHLSLIHI
eukprot:4889221-Pyramimonas_sp.AAC.1